MFLFGCYKATRIRRFGRSAYRTRRLVFGDPLQRKIGGAQSKERRYPRFYIRRIQNGKRRGAGSGVVQVGNLIARGRPLRRMEPLGQSRPRAARNVEYAGLGVAGIAIINKEHFPVIREARGNNIADGV